jgi:hypothetical protein
MRRVAVVSRDRTVVRLRSPREVVSMIEGRLARLDDADPCTQAYRRAFERLRANCGCTAGTRALLVTAAGYTAVAILGPVTPSSTLQVFAAVVLGVAVTMAAGIAGKLVALARNRRRLVALGDELLALAAEK